MTVSFTLLSIFHLTRLIIVSFLHALYVALSLLVFLSGCLMLLPGASLIDAFGYVLHYNNNNNKALTYQVPALLLSLVVGYCPLLSFLKDKWSEITNMISLNSYSA